MAISYEEKKRMRDEFAQLRGQLPADWKARFLEKHRRYNNLRGINKINNVARGLSTDKKVLEFCKTLINTNQNHEQS